MKAASFAYRRPSDLLAALALMAETDGTAKIIAGGQSLGPMLNLRLVSPDLIIDVSGLPELNRAERQGDELVIGACITHGDIEDERIPDVTRGAMQRVAAAIAYRAVRNRGTIGGSLSHADPAADWVSALAALGARVTLQSLAGERHLAIEAFVTGALETALEPGELVTSVRVPAMQPTARWGYVKACRKPGEFAHAIAAVLIDPEAAAARVVIGAIDAAPIVLGDAASLFDGRVSRDFGHHFDARAADRLLQEAGIADSADRHIRVAVLGRAVRGGSGMSVIGLTVNARRVEANVEPRTHLADFLRDGLNLTGTHLGCEHGVCGACTLLLDDMPARSCITYAAACDGARVTTIEGLDEDEIAIELRAAFTREHALQCGYCTPGMLISARDLVLRLPAADERQIRVGLSGNLCRCTGYVGIVRAVRSVIEQRRQRGLLPVPGAGRTRLGPVGSGNAANPLHTGAEKTSPSPMAAAEDDAGGVIAIIPDFVPAEVVMHHVTVAYPPDRVFQIFSDVASIAACLPGVALTGMPTPGRAEGAIRVKLGPISAHFRGAARIESDPAHLSGRITGIGKDQRSRSATQGEIRYQLVAIDHGAATRIDLSIGYSLTGMLAQIARPGLVRDLAARLAEDFARNLERRLGGVAPDCPAATAQGLDGTALLIDLLRARAGDFFRRIFRT